MKADELLNYKMTYKEFVNSKDPLLVARYEMFQFRSHPEDLIGRKVISIRSGFSNIGGGQVMIVDKISSYGDNETHALHLSHCELTKFGNYDRQYIQTHSGWLCELHELEDSIVLYTDEIYKMFNGRF